MAYVRAVLVPIKAFSDAKGRLAPVLDASERIALSRRLAEGVLRSAGELDLFVVCDDKEVASFAESLAATVIWTPRLGLSGAVSKGVATMAKAGVSTAVIAHGDLARPSRLAAFSSAASEVAVTLVPDRRRNGTNVICLPAGADFAFSYGPLSFAKHFAEAARLGLGPVVVEDDELSIDIDLPSDLGFLRPAS